MARDCVAVCGQLLLAGLLGSLGHCLGMCAPLMALVALEARARHIPVTAAQGCYHGGRIAAYAILGMVAGALGSLVDLAAGLSRAAGGLSLAFGLAVAVAGLAYLAAWSTPGIGPGQGGLAARMAAVLRRGGLWGLALLGVLTGLLPCCLLYGALLMAGATARPLAGGLGMACFGLGTAPALIGIGAGSGLLGARARWALGRAAGAFLLVVGLQLTLRGLAQLHLVSHLQLASYTLW